MSDSERHALTLSLLGTGKPGDPPGPLNPGWVVRHLAGTRTTLQRWRRAGIPPERLDDVLAAIGSLSPERKEEAPPHWAVELLDKIDAIYERQGVVADEAIVKLTQVLATGGGSEQVQVMRAALADALAETAHGAQPADEPAEPTGGVEGAGESPRLPPPSDRSLAD